MGYAAVKRTPAQQKLKDMAGRRQAELAEILGCTQQSISKWAAGVVRPSPFWRKVIARKLKIAERGWLTEEEIAILGAAA